MSKPGPAKKPTALKRLAGNPGKRPLPKHEPQPSGKPTMPAGLPPLARSAWRRLAPELIRLGLLKACDRDTFAALCRAIALAHEAQKAVTRYGVLVKGSYDGSFVRNPATVVLVQAQSQLRKLAAEFGLTPASRAGLEVAPAGGPEKPASKPFDFTGPRGVA